MRHRSRCASWMLVAACCAGASSAQEQEAVATQAYLWPDNFVTRLEAMALLQTLNAQLLSHDSATLSLESWCALHHLASPAQIIAQRVSGAEKSPDDRQRELLHVKATDSVRYRRVRLFCGSLELSDADNWYVPSRLTAQMNAQLEDSDVPFGRVVQSLNFQRHTLSSTVLWQPLPAGWEVGARLPGMGAPGLCIPPAILEHRAVLTLPDGTPFSLVVETYRSALFAFPAPAVSASQSPE